MKQLILVVYVTIVGCGGVTEMSNNGDAGPGGTSSATSPEQQLSASLSSWCPQICAKLIQCQAPGIDSTCVSECNDSVGKDFLGRGDACAQYALNFMNCLNSASCADLANGNSGACDLSSSASDNACGRLTTYPDMPTSNATVPDASAPTSNPTGPIVSCQSGSGMSSVGSPPIGATVCQNNLSGCTDGHTYGVTCSNAGNNQLTCACYRDGLAAQVSFDVAGSSCPSVQIVNSACGWQLARI